MVFNVRELIASRVASTSRVVEDGPDRLVLQDNWMSHAGCAPAFLLFGLLVLLVPDPGARLVGIAFCAVAILVLAWGLWVGRRRMSFDGKAGVLRYRDGNGRPATLPFDDISRLERRALELHGDGDPLYYHRLVALTRDGGEVLVCESQDEAYVADLAAKVARLTRSAVSVAVTESVGR